MTETPKEVEALMAYYQKEFGMSGTGAVFAAFEDWDNFKAGKPVSDNISAILNKFEYERKRDEAIECAMLADFQNKERKPEITDYCSEITVNGSPIKEFNQGPAKEKISETRGLCSSIIVNGEKVI